MNPKLPSLSVLGVRVAKLTRDQALAELVRLHGSVEGPPATLAFVNAHTLNLASRDAAFRELLNRTDLVLNDGAGLNLAARLQGERFPDNLNGTDLTPRLLALAAEKGWKVFFLGAKPGIAARAAERLQLRIPGLEIVGVQDGYFPPEALPAVLESIRLSGASVLVVALGNPRQEEFLDANLAASGCRLGLGVGAFFDFAADNVSRAPPWMRTAGVEWMFRLSLEPGRLWKRYVLGNPAFVARVVRERFKS